MNQQEFLNKLSTLDKELGIRELCESYWDKNLAPMEGRKLNDARQELRTAIRKVFPDILDINQEKPKGYYETDSKDIYPNKTPRFEHLSLWYLTSTNERRCLACDELRKDYTTFIANLTGDNEANKKVIAHYLAEISELDNENMNDLRTLANKTYQIKNVSKFSKHELIYKIIQAKRHPENIQTESATQTKKELSLKHMNIETLELDADTQAIVQTALDHSGISLAEFIQKACTVYATTLVGKFKQFESDLSSVSTAELLTAKYKTHPGRAREMVIRAIQAIKIFNGNEPEPTNRWMITQTAIQSLTGSKPATVKEILPDYQTDIDDYNTSCNFSSPYINRKPGKRIEDVINVAELVPEGI